MVKFQLQKAIPRMTIQELISPNTSYWQRVCESFQENEREAVYQNKVLYVWLG